MRETLPYSGEEKTNVSNIDRSLFRTYKRGVSINGKPAIDFLAALRNHVGKVKEGLLHKATPLRDIANLRDKIMAVAKPLVRTPKLG